MKQNFDISPQRERELVERFDEPTDNYNLLRSDVQAFAFLDGSKRKNQDDILRMYTTFADKVIGVADGSIKSRDLIDPDNPEKSTQPPDVMIFLDKSARPVSWFVDAFWEQFAKKDAIKPEYDFLNIDRTAWFMKQGYSKDEAERYLDPSHFDISKVDKEDIARIRAIFVDGDLTESNWQNEVWELKTRLDGKNIVIVDEVKNKGGTLFIAQQLLKKAIPEATFSGQYFWESNSRIINDLGETQNDSVPVWYDSESDMGRGIGNVSKLYREYQYKLNPTLENLIKLIAWQLLSAPHHNKDSFEEIDDPKAKKLEQDINFMTYGVGAGKILHSPSLKREDDDVVEILKKQNITPQESTYWRENSSRLKNRYGKNKEE